MNAEEREAERRRQQKAMLEQAKAAARVTGKKHWHGDGDENCPVCALIPPKDPSQEPESGVSF